MPRTFAITVYAVLTSTTFVSAQVAPRMTNPAVVVAGSDYRLAGPAQAAAPGQLLLLSVYGVRKAVPTPIRATPTLEGWPLSLGGISVDLVEGQPEVVTPIRLRAIQQGFCAVAEACGSITQITLQLPFSFGRPVGAPLSFLRVKEDGVPVGGVMLVPSTDRIHVLNTCDATQISIGAASSAPPDVCTSAVLVNGRLNSLYNLVHGGDQVALWAYGLGLMNRDPASISLYDGFTAAGEYLINVDYRPNAPASPAVPGFGTVVRSLYAGYTAGGTYQVNFAIPSVPENLPACDGVNIKSNLTVTITGASSWDAAQLCVAVK